MDKNFVLAMAAALLVFFGYNTFTAQKHIQTKQTITQPQIQQTQQKIKGQNSLVSLSAKKQEIEKFTTVETQHAKIVFTTKGAAIKDFFYKDFNTDLNLTPFGNEGYFATLNDVNFEQIAAENGDDVAYQTQIANNVWLVKSYKTNKEQGLNKLSISFVNKTKEDLNLSDFYLSMGPGLNTVKSELSDNAANLRAVCAHQEKGKKNITVNDLKAKTFNNSAKLQALCENWIWAGIDNRYFLSALIPTNW